MNRRDDRAFQRALVTKPGLAFITRSRAQECIDLCAHALAHLVRGAIRKGDRDDVIDGNVFGAEDFQIALDQHGRLAGARTGSDGEVAIECVRGCGLLGL